MSPAPRSRRARLEIAHTWDGRPLAPAERAWVSLQLEPSRLWIEVDAPFHGDPPPPGPAGSRDALWEFEVIELFLLGEAQRYLEVELGPHRHYLVLILEGPRQVRRRGLPLDFEASCSGDRWTGRAQLPADWLPRGLFAANAYAIHGRGASRRYLACHPVGDPGGGDAPDFHRLERFGPLRWEEEAGGG